MRRLFIALEPDEATRALAMEVAASLRQGLETRARLGFTPTERLHVTLAFLGGVEEERLEEVGAVVADVAREHARFLVEAGGVGAFPRSEAARVLWLGFGSESDLLRTLVRDLETRLRAAGHTLEDRPWTGHVTLARCHAPRGVDAHAELARCSDRRIECLVAELVVMESIPDPGRARYVALARARLATARDGRVP